MQIRQLDRAALGPQNNHSQRLVPWPALNAPFEGAWCVVEPGTSTTRHAHHEYEMFVAVSGTAALDSAGDRSPFTAGDVAHFPPHTDHQVVNDGTEQFQFYAVWWDQDLSQRFVARHRDGG